MNWLLMIHLVPNTVLVKMEFDGKFSDIYLNKPDRQR